MSQIKIVEGDLLDQDIEVIVNAWNRSIIPWWLLLPQGVSAAIKRRAGYEPFRQLARCGPILLGGAVLMQVGRLPFKAIIHVAGISMWWRSLEQSIGLSCRSAIALAKEHGFGSIASPLVGAGTGGGTASEFLAMMCDELETCDSKCRSLIVKFVKR